MGCTAAITEDLGREIMQRTHAVRNLRQAVIETSGPTQKHHTIIVCKGASTKTETRITVIEQWKQSP